MERGASQKPSALTQLQLFGCGSAALGGKGLSDTEGPPWFHGHRYSVSVTGYMRDNAGRQLRIRLNISPNGTAPGLLTSTTALRALEC